MTKLPNAGRTPTPWRLAGHDTVASYSLPAPYSVIVAECPGYQSSREANAEFIVRACNAHEELVAALKDAYQHVALLGSGQIPEFSNAEMCSRLGIVLGQAKS